MRSVAGVVLLLLLLVSALPVGSAVPSSGHALAMSSMVRVGSTSSRGLGPSASQNHTVTFTESGLPGGANRSGNGSVGLHLVVEFLAGYMPALDNVISLAPYLKAGDNVDIYDYSSTNPIDPTLVGQDAVKLRAAVPSGVAISVVTGLIPNVQKMAGAHPTDVNGGLGDTYEPYGATAPGTYAFSAALQNFSKVNQIAHNAGYTSVAYSTGHPLLHELSYHWNYGQIAQKTDLVWIEAQEYAFAGATTPSVWSTAMATLASQFASTGEPLSHLAVQIDLGSSATGNDPQGWGVTPPTCISEIRTALTYGINDIYLWTARGAEVLLAQLLHNLTQEIPQRSQTSSPSGGSSVAMNWSVTLNGVVHTSNTSTISFSEPNGTYSYTVESPVGIANGTWYAATPANGSVSVAGGNASVRIGYQAQSYYPVRGTVRASNGTVPSGVTLMWSTATGRAAVPVDAAGNFSVDLANGTYNFTALAPGFSPTSVLLTVNGSALTGVTLNLSRPSTTAPPPFYPISGAVVNGSSGAPLGGAAVFLRGADSSQELATNSSGEFSSSLTNGTYGVRVNATGYIVLLTSLSVNGTGLSLVYALNSTVSPIVENATSPTNTSASTEVPVVVQVVASSTGASLANTTCYVTDLANRSTEVVKTDANGLLHLALPNGTYPLEIRTAGFSNTEVDVSVHGPLLTPLPVSLAPAGTVVPGHVARSLPALAILASGAGVTIVVAFAAYLVSGGGALPILLRRRGRTTVRRLATELRTLGIRVGRSGKRFLFDRSRTTRTPGRPPHHRRFRFRRP